MHIPQRRKSYKQTFLTKSSEYKFYCWNVYKKDRVKLHYYIPAIID